MESNLEKVRAAIISAVPEIEIWACEGCNTVYAEYVNGCPKCWDENLSREENQKKYPKRGVDVTYRNITLADVLQTLTKDWYRDSKNFNAWVFFGTEKDDLLCVLTLWDFNESFENQSEKFKSFLSSLLLGNK